MTRVGELIEVAYDRRLENVKSIREIEIGSLERLGSSASLMN